MAALLLLVVVTAIAGGIWFFLQQRKCATAVCSKKNDPPTTGAAEPTLNAPTPTGGEVRQRPSKPTELDQRDLFAEFMEKEALSNPSPAHTPRKGSADKCKTEKSASSTAPTEAPTQLSELSAAVTPLPSALNTPSKDVQTAALLPTPTGTTPSDAPPSAKRPSKTTQGGVDEPTLNETASKKKMKKKKRGSRMSANKTATTSSKSKKSKKSKKGKKKSAGK